MKKVTTSNNAAMSSPPVTPIHPYFNSKYPFGIIENATTVLAEMTSKYRIKCRKVGADPVSSIAKQWRNGEQTLRVEEIRREISELREANLTCPPSLVQG
jgi:hypothetical protein